MENNIHNDLNDRQTTDHNKSTRISDSSFFKRTGDIRALSSNGQFVDDVNSKNMPELRILKDESQRFKDFIPIETVHDLLNQNHTSDNHSAHLQIQQSSIIGNINPLSNLTNIKVGSHQQLSNLSASDSIDQLVKLNLQQSETLSNSDNNVPLRKSEYNSVKKHSDYEGIEHYEQRNDISPSNLKISYQRMPIIKQTYIAYVVAIQNPLNLHLDIYWPRDIEERYAQAHHYTYEFISEEYMEEDLKNNNNPNTNIRTRNAYSCHLKGIEINTSNNEFSSMKESFIYVTKKIYETNGWVLISVLDIDVYGRILINLFGIIDRYSINHKLLSMKNARTGEPIAREYIRPAKEKPVYKPDNVPSYYHIIYNSKNK